ncbi:MAG: MinD/ParA family protein [Clostridiales bacterium]|nr:MinD/ParA family protein [Clostridiales bacterium]
MSDQIKGLREMMNKNKKTKVITVTSGKGGVGKTSVALNMAIELSRRGRRVLLIDADFGFSNIDVMLGVSTKYNLMHVLSGKKEVCDIIENGVYGVQYISGGSGIYDLVKTDTFQINRLLNGFRTLDEIADIIIFDTSSGVSENILRMIHASNETILVTTPEPTSITDAYSLTKIACEQKGKPVIKLVMNKASSKKEADAAMDGFLKIAEKYIDIEIEKLGYILRDDNMAKAVKMQQPLLVSFPKSNAAINIGQIVDQYLNVAHDEKQSLGITGFLNRFTSNNEFKLEKIGGNNELESSSELG